MDPEAMAAFRAEAMSSARLNHPGVVQVHDVGEAVIDGVPRPYLVMEMIEGQPLSHLLVDGTPLTVERSLEIGVDVTSALAHAHERGLVHRDVTPGNLMVLRDGSVKVTDFGIARAMPGAVLARGRGVDRGARGGRRRVRLHRLPQPRAGPPRLRRRPLRPVLRGLPAHDHAHRVPAVPRGAQGRGPPPPAHPAAVPVLAPARSGARAGRHRRAGPGEGPVGPAPVRGGDAAGPAAGAGQIDAPAAWAAGRARPGHRGRAPRAAALLGHAEESTERVGTGLLPDAAARRRRGRRARTTGRRCRRCRCCCCCCWCCWCCCCWCWWRGGPGRGGCGGHRRRRGRDRGRRLGSPRRRGRRTGDRGARAGRSRGGRPGRDGCLPARGSDGPAGRARTGRRCRAGRARPGGTGAPGGDGPPRAARHGRPARAGPRGRRPGLGRARHPDPLLARPAPAPTGPSPARRGSPSRRPAGGWRRPASCSATPPPCPASRCPAAPCWAPTRPRAAPSRPGPRST